VGQGSARNSQGGLLPQESIGQLIAPPRLVEEELQPLEVKLDL